MDGILEWITRGAQPDLDWNFALITLTFRFIAVFVVLWLIQAAMQFSAFAIRRIEEKEKRDKAAAAAAPASTSVSRSASSADAGNRAMDTMTAAAIGIAIELDSQPEAVRVEEQRDPSAWGIAGRVNQLSKR